MTDSVKQNISAFMDAEEELVNSLKTTDKARWERYHLIGEAIKNNAPEIITDAVATRVSQSLKSENPILAPTNIKSSPFKNRRFAIAASVTGALALGSVVWLQSANDNPMVSRFADVTNTQTKTHVVVENGKKIERLSDPRLNAYITQHDASIIQSSPRHSSQIRIVSYPE